MDTVKKVVTNLPAYIAYVRKALINILGLLVSLLSLGLLPDRYATTVATIVAVLTVVVHYKTSNAPKPIVADPGIDDPLI